RVVPARLSILQFNLPHPLLPLEAVQSQFQDMSDAAGYGLGRYVVSYLAILRFFFLFCFAFWSTQYSNAIIGFRTTLLRARKSGRLVALFSEYSASFGSSYSDYNSSHRFHMPLGL